MGENVCNDATLSPTADGLSHVLSKASRMHLVGRLVFLALLAARTRGEDDEHGGMPSELQLDPARAWESDVDFEEVGLNGVDRILPKVNVPDEWTLRTLEEQREAAIFLLEKTRQNTHWGPVVTKLAQLLERAGDMKIKGIARSRDFHNVTALHHAAIFGRADWTRLLLQAHADPAAQSGDARTPLEEATARDHVDVVRLLLDAGAADREPNAQVVHDAHKLVEERARDEL